MAQNGDEDAFDLLFESFKTEAVRTAYLLTGNASICEDIAQEAFITCFKHIGELKNPCAFRAWFYRILTRVSFRQGALCKREIATDDVIERTEKASIRHSLDKHMRSETNQMLYAEISNLTFEHRAVITLYYFNELSIKEIAKVTHCFEGTVKSRLYAARSILKKRIEASESDKKERMSLAQSGRR